MRRRREWGGGRYQLVQPATLEGYSERHRTMPWVHGEGVSPSWRLILSFLGPSGFPLQFSLQLHPNGCPQAVLGLSQALHLWQSERKGGPEVKVQRGSLTLTLSTVVSPEGIFPLQLRSPFVLGKAGSGIFSCSLHWRFLKLGILSRGLPIRVCPSPKLFMCVLRFA